MEERQKREADMRKKEEERQAKLRKIQEARLDAKKKRALMS